MGRQSEKKRAGETVIAYQLEEGEDGIYNLKARLGAAAKRPRRGRSNRWKTCDSNGNG